MFVLHFLKIAQSDTSIHACSDCNDLFWTLLAIWNGFNWLNLRSLGICGKTQQRIPAPFPWQKHSTVPTMQHPRLDLLQTYLIQKPDRFLALFPAEDTDAKGDDTRFHLEDVWWSLDELWWPEIRPGFWFLLPPLASSKAMLHYLFRTLVKKTKHLASYPFNTHSSVEAMYFCSYSMKLVQKLRAQIIGRTVDIWAE